MLCATNFGDSTSTVHRSATVRQLVCDGNHVHHGVGIRIISLS